ncbi:uncharacterized protein LOC17879318 [Capsella rubella]|uniref:uncharacterized protein LOC17879318 n=1 Tax=Capsella rubella TaxID=81985 RepID=UPI000CD5C450|nr:uncharacterized protein LOC17879318 [Capsella rubella]
MVILEAYDNYPGNKILEGDHISCLSLNNGSHQEEKKLSPNVVKVESSLKQEIIELEKTLQSQFDVRNDLEMALGYKETPQDYSIFTSKPAKELIKEIAILEFEVSNLEQYLLWLYRKAFDQQASVYLSPSSKRQRSISPKSTLRSKCDIPRKYEPPKHENQEIEYRCFSFDNRIKDPVSTKSDIDSSVRRCQSLLDQRSTFTNIISPREESIKEVSINDFSSLLSSIGIRIPLSDHIPIMTPNKLSEEMIKYASTMYCKLSDTRFLSSTSKLWSLSFRKNSAFDDKIESSAPYNSMIEVSHIERKGHDFELMLRHFRFLIKQLGDVDMKKLTHQEKLAFWINVHNSLVMHTYLVNGIPKNNGKRFLLFSKPAYNIGGCVVSIEILQNSILLSRMPCPQQWLRLLLTSKKLRAGDDYQEYSLEHPEPLLYFALCSGIHSDPAVRVYTAESIYLELETAKENYIRETIRFKSDHKLILPRIIESFSKDSGMNQAALMEMIKECLSEPMRNTIKKINMGRSRKSNIEWIPHNFRYRYLIAREVIK